MAKSVFTNIAIRGLAAAVPKQRVRHLTDHTFLEEKERRNIVALTGIEEYRKAPADICASDLCATAASTLLEEMQVPAESVDALIFTSMTPDYVIPSTACLLQSRLGLSTTSIAYDINMGCSGYIVGLYNACALIQGGQLKRVLLLTGDTQSKLCYREDKTVVFLMGDGGTATLLEADASAREPITIEIYTDGSKFDKLYVPAGGFRTPSSEKTREIRRQKDGGTRSEDHIFMDGMEIFKFSTTDVVKTLRSFTESSNIDFDTLDYLVLHQANKFMTDKIGRKLKIAAEKIPYSLKTYGNTGSASIPLTIVNHRETLAGNPLSHCLLAGFGVGLSWGFADLVLRQPCLPQIVEI